MCTFNLAIDDMLVERVRPSFPDEKALNEWMKKQMAIVLQNFVASQDKKELCHAHKHDALMGVLKDAPELDYKALHLSEKYGI